MVPTELQFNFFMSVKHECYSFKFTIMIRIVSFLLLNRIIVVIVAAKYCYCLDHADYENLIVVVIRVVLPSCSALSAASFDVRCVVCVCVCDLGFRV